MNKLKEWLLLYLYMGTYIWKWCSIAACVYVPLILSWCYGPWWYLSLIVTIPAACTTMILMGKGKEENQE